MDQPTGQGQGTPVLREAVRLLLGRGTRGILRRHVEHRFCHVGPGRRDRIGGHVDRHVHLLRRLQAADLRRSLLDVDDLRRGAGADLFELGKPALRRDGMHLVGGDRDEHDRRDDVAVGGKHDQVVPGGPATPQAETPAGRRERIRRRRGRRWWRGRLPEHPQRELPGEFRGRLRSQRVLPREGQLRRRGRGRLLRRGRQLGGGRQLLQRQQQQQQQHG
mmetsp:Transcript_108102/g.220730  ORF Transcript_108102/g.220730 Transcript_108102/m.220730 type:complete len:219 (-) Transcript_108102:2113-2769(-)